MATVGSRDLRNRTRELLQRAAAGEDVLITVAGRPVAVLRPVGARARWVTRAEFTRNVATRQADPALRAELNALAPDTTDDVP